MPGHVAGGAANDLRSYLQRSVVLRSRALAEASRRSEPIAPVLANGNAKPILNSIDEILAHLRAEQTQQAPRAILVIAARPEIDATNEALRIARALSREQPLCVLVDLTHGAAALGVKLGIPRTPGLAELADGRVSFDDIVQVDKETPLQVIPAGQSIAKQETKLERLARIFEALAQVYHFMVLHADRETAFNYQPVLAGRLRAALAVLASGEGKSRRAGAALSELAGFGCAVMLHEQSPERRWFSRRSA
jgi:Mrp family chromosome partitioning ATPase